jgi:hypothetical protein
VYPCKFLECCSCCFESGSDIGRIMVIMKMELESSDFLFWVLVSECLCLRGSPPGCNLTVCVRLQRFQRRDRDEGRRDGGRDSGAGADRERQRRERLQQQKRGQWNAYWQDKNAPRIVYNSSVFYLASSRSL